MWRIFAIVFASIAMSGSAFAQVNFTPTPTSFAGKRIMQILNRLQGAEPSALPSSAPGGNGIQYNGGPIMDDANGVNVYFIWYGDWSRNTLAQQVLVNFITHIGGSSYFNINTTYYSLGPGQNGKNVVKDSVINAAHYLGSTTDNYSQGSSINQIQVGLIIANAATSGALPLDTNGVYFVLASPDVTETDGFCTVFCGFHGSQPLSSGAQLVGAFIGDAETQCPFNCIWNYQTTMSGSLGADGMASLIAHELEESVTDPYGTSWVNLPDFSENGDLCAWTFGKAYHSGTASDPYPPNMKFDGVPYLIQQNWVNANGGYCALHWDN